MVECEEVQKVGKVDIDLIAQRDHAGKPNRAMRCPFHHASCDGARLRNEGEIAAFRHAGGKARIELDSRRDDAEAIGADEAKPETACRLLAGGCERAWTMSQSGGDDDS